MEMNNGKNNKIALTIGHVVENVPNNYKCNHKNKYGYDEIS
jgi:hypothetical protein